MDINVLVHGQLRVVKNGRGFVFSLDELTYLLTCFLIPMNLLEKYGIQEGDIFAVVDYEDEVQIFKVGKFDLSYRDWKEFYKNENAIIGIEELKQFRVLVTVRIRRKPRRMKLDDYMNELLNEEVERAILPVLAKIPDRTQDVH